jgi:ATP-binding cassette subfamily B (MDR/TAP) protein 6
VVFVTRYIAEITLTILSAFHLFNTNHPHSSETAPLLGSATTENYGTSQQQQQQQQQPKVFTNFIDKMKKLFPYIWPYNNKKLQLYIVLCFLIMCAGFVVGVLTPLQIGRLVDSLGKGNLRTDFDFAL